MLEVFRRLGSIQFDPLAIAGRTHDLVLHARVAGYEPAWCDLLYERREIFEAYNKGLSLVPTSAFPWFRGNLSRSAPRILAENADAAARVLERIRTEGPLSSLDFERERGATTDWFGMPTNVVRAVLEAYAVTGVLGLARRDGQPQVLRPARAVATRRRPCPQASARGTASLQASFAVPRARTARCGRRQMSSAGLAMRSPTSGCLVIRDVTLCGTSSSPTARSFRSTSKECAENATS